jgi:hypothetical protein
MDLRRFGGSMNIGSVVNESFEQIIIVLMNYILSFETMEIFILFEQNNYFFSIAL